MAHSMQFINNKQVFLNTLLTLPTTLPRMPTTLDTSFYIFMQISEIQALVADEMQQVVQILADSFGTDVALIKEISQHIHSGGGKRLRPMLAILSAKACGYQGEQAILLAAIVELIHTATLLHDDVVDESAMRRGKQTANVVWDNKSSVLVGDFLYSRAFQMMVQIQRMDVMHILANAANTIAEGEVMQLQYCNDPSTDEKRYFATIVRKTATLFEAACELGAVISEQTSAFAKPLASYGLNLGIAFQLVDDALDYGSSKSDIGKNMGDDLAEGKPTLPLIYALSQANGKERAMIEQAITHGGSEHVSAIQTTLRNTGAIEYTYQCAEQHIAKALHTIKVLPDTVFRHSLEALAEFALQRSY